MKTLTQLIKITLFLLFASLESVYSNIESEYHVSKDSWPLCTSHSVGGDNCTLSVFEVSSTQFSLGMSEVNCKANLLNTLSKSEIIKYLQKEDMIVPIVVGPDGFYMTNGHHLARALIQSDISSSLKYLFCTVTNNFSDMDKEDFWRIMVEFQYVWLYDEKGNQPVDPAYIPNVDVLLDDPYRSLAWMARNQGAYEKTTVPFADFMWANYFRSRIHLLNITDTETETDIVIDIEDNGDMTNSKNGNSNEISSNSISMKKKELMTSLPMPVNPPTSWNWCEVRPFDSVCFVDQTDALNTALPIAISISLLPEASTLPGFNKGTIQPENCGKSSSLMYNSDKKIKLSNQIKM